MYSLYLFTTHYLVMRIYSIAIHSPIDRLMDTKRRGLTPTKLLPRTSRVAHVCVPQYVSNIEKKWRKYGKLYATLDHNPMYNVVTSGRLDEK